MKKTFKLPPVEFSNSMNIIYGKVWDCRRWETSKEWRLWNAGKETAARDVLVYAKLVAEGCGRTTRNENF